MDLAFNLLHVLAADLSRFQGSSLIEGMKTFRDLSHQQLINSGLEKCITNIFSKWLGFNFAVPLVFKFECN